MGEWNAILDRNIDRRWTILGTNNPDLKPFRNFNDRLDLADNFRNKLHRQVVLIGLINSALVRFLRTSYIFRVLGEST